MSEQYTMRLAVATVAAVFLAAGCGAGDQPADRPAGEPEALPVDMATAATVTGRVVFEGTPPDGRPIDMAAEPTCRDMHAEPPVDQPVAVNADGTLRNVFVYVKEGLGDLSFPTPREPAVIDQVGCIYTPRVVGVQVGQDLLIRNSDGLLHNINARANVNRGFNISQPTSMEGRRSFRMPEVMIPFRCDVHGWMVAYIGVLEHPYHGVTQDGGTFELSPLPPGDYVIEAWHERYGTQTMQVSVGASERAEITFTFREGMADAAGVPLGQAIDPHGDHGAHHAHTTGSAGDR